MRLLRVLVDVTIRCSINHSSPKASFEKAEKEKQAKYRNLARECGAKFVALVFDAFGGWSESARKAFNDWRCVRRLDPEVQQAFADLKQEISVAIHRFNGKAFADGVAFSRLADVNGGGAA